MSTIALDIGGANLKASDGRSRSVSRPFAIWKEPGRLVDELRELLGEFYLSPFPPLATHGFTETRPRDRESESQPRGRGSQRLAVTMTAELADCFDTKAEGVHFILDAVQQVAGESEVQVWQTGGEFVTLEDARELVPLVAAANWHALATWTARMTLGPDDSSALLIDLGSTTCDIIPLRNGLPMQTGRTDVERLMSGELVYTGVRRTPVMAVCQAVPFRGESVPLAAELFATMLDVYLLTGEIAEDADDTNTANGRPATIAAAWDRIARSLCCDRNECSLEEACEIAVHLRAEQHRQIANAIQRVSASLPVPAQVVLSGEGEPMLRDVLATIEFGSQSPRPTLLSLREMLGSAHSSCACAYALARLAMES